MVNWVSWTSTEGSPASRIGSVPAGDGGADFVLGLPYQYGRGVSTGKTWEQSSNVIGIYAQDTWRVTDRLTLNLGLRYDAHTPWVETNDQQANYNFATGNIDLAGKNGASRALYNGFYGGRDFQPRIGFAWTPAALGGRTVIRGAFTISSYLEGTGTNLRLTLNPPFTPAEINAIYNNTALPAAPIQPTELRARRRLHPAMHQPMLATLRLSSGSGIPMCSLRSRINGTLTVQHQFGGNTTVQDRVCRAEGHTLDGAVRLCAESSCMSCCDPTVSAPSPYFASQPDALHCSWATLLRAVEGATVSGTKSNGNMRYNSLQAVLQKQMTSRSAVSSLLYLLQVHVRQHGVLRRVEQCPECLSILAECLRSAGGVGAVLLRCHPRPFSLCGLRSSLWTRQDVGQERQ